MEIVTPEERFVQRLKALLSDVNQRPGQAPLAQYADALHEANQNFKAWVSEAGLQGQPDGAYGLQTKEHWDSDRDSILPVQEQRSAAVAGLNDDQTARLDALLTSKFGRFVIHVVHHGDIVTRGCDRGWGRELLQLDVFIHE